MVSGEHKRAALHEKLQLLRSITNSHAKSETSIIIDASNYIQELKHKVERLNQETETVKKSIEQQYSWPTLTVETLEKGFLVNVFSDKSCPGLLVFILEAFEELGLNVMEARVSCSASFQLEALGGANEENGENIDAQVVKHAISQAVKIWSEISEKD